MTATAGSPRSRTVARVGRRALVAAVAVLVATAAGPVAAAEPTPTFISPSAPWLSVVNYYRAMARLAPVTEDPTLSAGAYNHSCYMLYNGITHDEIPGSPGYTTSGDAAGNNGNVAVSSVYGTTSRRHIELWMTGPYHAIGILRSTLTRVGFGKCDNDATSPWKSGATMNVINGIDRSLPKPTTPVLFPGNGMTTSLDMFVTESPNPISVCGWTGTAGLPVIALMPEAVSTLSASITGPSGPLQVCRVFAGNTSGVARDILAGENAVAVIPRNKLDPGKYSVSITTQARTVNWSFTVDPAAATGIMPIPKVTPAGPTSRFTPVTPFRYADSRVPLRITKVTGGSPKRISMAGIAGIPSDASAVSANFSVTGASKGGFLTVYACSETVPTSSTLNFGGYETVANAGIFPLSAGALCVYSPTSVHLVIDVNGYTRASSSNLYNGMVPTPVVDTARGLAASGNRPAGSTLQVKVTGSGTPVPAGATAVALNIAGVQPTANGYITAYACDGERPGVSNVNASVGTTKQNFAIVPVAPDGTVCLYNLSEVGLRVDVLGYFSPAVGTQLTPANATRIIDTRDQFRPEMNFGLAGSRIPALAPQTLVIAGQRGVPSDATSVSVNVAVIPAATGTLTVWGCGATTDAISMSFSGGKVVATGMQVRLGASGDLCVRADVPVHLVIDLVGYWT